MDVGARDFSFRFLSPRCFKMRSSRYTASMVRRSANTSSIARVGHELRYTHAHVLGEPAPYVNPFIVFNQLQS